MKKNIRKALNYLQRAWNVLFRKKHTWSSDASGTLKNKGYKDYEEYLAHQKSKLKEVGESALGEYDNAYRKSLRERLASDGYVEPGMSVLCLAARIGTEVKAFLDARCFAVGIDLEPGAGNKYVVHGDFQDIQFVDNTLDVVFTNSLDHVFDLDRVVAEMKRVLKPNGLVILEIVKGEEEGYQPGYYEATIWKNIDAALRPFLDAGFVVLKRESFTHPWNGDHVVLRLSKDSLKR